MPRVLKIITSPNEALRKKSKKINFKEFDSSDLKELCLAMEKTMLEKDGVGLAAPQIGKNIRLFTINTQDGVIAMINPEIIKKSLLKVWGEEGCLSIPGVFGQVKRHKKITVEYRTPKGKKLLMAAEGLLARVIQHENDHLDGILFIDKAENITDKEKLDKT